MRRRPLRMLAAVLAATLTATVAAAAVGSGAASATTVPSTFTFTGAGFGHGVGMSQYGALGMAKGGSTAAQILTHYYTGGAAVTAVSDNVSVRVNILHAATSFTLGSRALAVGGGQIEVIVNGLPYVLGTATDAWTVSAAGTLVTVKKNGVSIGSGTTVGIYWAGTRNPGVSGAIATAALVNGRPYKYGAIDARVVSGKLEVVNPVLVHDEYLRGIAEMPSSWPAAALQAQVVAARSYAMSKLSGLRAACVCNVYGSTLDQVFVGYTKETSAGGAQWVAAVTATEPSTTTGSAMTYKGSIITAYYFSSTGGRTQNSEDVWVAALPWARSVDDHWSLDPTINPTYAHWVQTRTQAQVAAAFGLPNVATITVTAWTAGGGVRTAVARSSSGAQASLSGETLRSRLSLPSTWLQQPSSPPPPPPPPTPGRHTPPTTGTGGAGTPTGHRQPVGWPSP